MVAGLTDKELLEVVRTDPRSEQALKDHEEARLTDRKRWAAEMEKLTAAHEKALPALHSAAGAAAEKVKAAQKAVEEAQEGWRLAEAARRNAVTRFDSGQRELETKLRETAPAEITRFVKECADEWESIRRQGVTVVPVRRNWRGAMVGGDSNQVSVNARLQGLRSAQVAAEALKLASLTGDELAKELAALRNGIPEVKPPTVEA